MSPTDHSGAPPAPRYDPSWIDTDPYPQIIGGHERRDGQVNPIVDPSTGDVVGQWMEASSAEVAAAVAAARASHDSGEWSRLPTARRAEVLEAAAATIRADARRLATTESLDTGKNIHSSSVFDIYEAATAFSYAAAFCRTLTGDVRRTSFPPDLYPTGGPKTITMRLREPVGVVCELLPWNAPLMTGSQRIAAALAAGCSLVVKAPEEAVMSTTNIVRLLHRVGVPQGAINLVLGRGETVGEQLVADPRFDLISLTGGAATGRRVMEVAARNLTAVHLELGGKAPVIVFEDANLDSAITWAAMANFSNGGQVCVAGSRLLVQESVYADVVAGVTERCRGFRIGDALDHSTFIGPLVNVAHADKVRGFRDRAIAAGDAIVEGGGELPDGTPASYVAPIVLGRVRPGSEAEQQEIFGPVLSAIPFATQEEALAIANGTQYGLNASIFTASIERAFQMVDALDVGEVNINSHFTPDMNGAKGHPRKASGIGGADVEAYTTLKGVNLHVGW
jgi:acyl-CoA reductase-like NAD-dependent aldehyde dehydrogenase